MFKSQSSSWEFPVKKKERKEYKPVSNRIWVDTSSLPMKESDAKWVVSKWNHACGKGSQNFP